MPTLSLRWPEALDRQLSATATHAGVARSEFVRQTIAEHICALDRSRFGEGPLAALTAAEMAVVERSLRAVLGMK